MGLFSRSLLPRIFNRETRSQSVQTTVRTRDPYLSEFFGFGGSPAVTPETVLSNSAVAMRCVALRSEMLASVSLHVHRRSRDGGRNRADDLPLYGVLHDNANDWQSAFEFRELMVRCLDLHGNFFAKITRNNRGQVVALLPLANGIVSVERLTNGRLRYKVSDGMNGAEILLQDEVLHVRGPSRDGIMGQSPISMARGALGLALQQRTTAQALMANSLRPSAVLSYEHLMSIDNKQFLRDQLRERVGGPEKAGNFLILDGGGKYDKMSFSPEDAEFLDSMKLSNEDVARIFGVPPTSVGILDKGTYSNVEQESATLIQNCLGPLAARIEAAMARCLLTPEARRTIYIEHDLSSLLRGDVKSRFEAYRLGREIGALSANDVRRRENEPPIEGGEAYHMPANWVPLGTVPVVKGDA
jgi:HK97 family phage portal protein